MMLLVRRGIRRQIRPLRQTAEEVIASGMLGEDVQKAGPDSAAASTIPSRAPSSVGVESGDTLLEQNGRGPGAPDGSSRCGFRRLLGLDDDHGDPAAGVGRSRGHQAVAGRTG